MKAWVLLERRDALPEGVEVFSTEREVDTAIAQTWENEKLEEHGDYPDDQHIGYDPMGVEVMLDAWPVELRTNLEEAVEELMTADIIPEHTGWSPSCIRCMINEAVAKDNGETLRSEELCDKPCCDNPELQIVIVEYRWVSIKRWKEDGSPVAGTHLHEADGDERVVCLSCGTIKDLDDGADWSEYL